MRRLVAGLAAGVVALSMALSIGMFMVPSAPAPAPGCPQGSTSQPWQTGCFPAY